MNKLNNFTDDELRNIVNCANSFKDVVTAIGYSYNGGAGYTAIKIHLKKRNIEIPKYNTKYYNDTHVEYDISSVFIKNSTYLSGAGLKRKIIKYSLLKYECAICHNNGQWNNQKLILQLDHIDGIHNNNSLDNLRFLCPNCHSQTHTYSGKNKLKSNKNKHMPRSEYFKMKRELYFDKQQDKINAILSSNIDFSKFGWVSKVSELIGLRIQKVNGWMKRNMLDFYTDKCYKRN